MDMTDVFLVLLVFGGATALFWGWHFGRDWLQGDPVGRVAGLMQGEHSVPGVPARVVVRRSLSGGTPVSVTLQVRSMGYAKELRFQPAEAERLAQALEDGVAMANAEGEKRTGG